MLRHEGDHRHGRGLKWSSVIPPRVLDLECVPAAGPQGLFNTSMAPPPALCLFLQKPHERQNNRDLSC